MTTVSTPAFIDSGLQNAREVLDPVPLPIRGRFPPWLSGSLYRTGPGTFTISRTDGANADAQHWFDALGMIHRFDIQGGGAGITYQSRSTARGKQEKIERNGWAEVSFGQHSDPCQTTFAKFSTFYKTMTAAPLDGRVRSADRTNVSVTLSPNMPGLAHLAQKASTKDENGVPRYIVSKTDANALQVLDAVTLEPLAVTSFRAFDKRLNGPMAPAHPCTDEHSGDIFSFALAAGFTPVYTVYRLSAADGTVDVLAEIHDAPGAYIHSLFLTEKYVALCVWQADYAWGGLTTIWNRNIMEGFKAWDPSRQALFYVVDRNGAGLVGKYTAPAFFAFHSINSYDDGADVVLDVCVYPDSSVLDGLYLDNMRARGTALPRALARGSVRRYVLHDVTSASSSTKEAELVFSGPEVESIELPVVNPRQQWKRHRFAYGISRAHVESAVADRLLKLDMSTSPPRATEWAEKGCAPGEPIFVPRPDGLLEDDGVLLSVVLDDAGGKSMLVCLDARDMKEVARAEMDHPFPVGFHGAFVQ